MKSSPSPSPERLIAAVDARLSEFFDGYLAIGFIAGSGEAIVVRRCQDPKTRLALQTLVVNVMAEEGV